MKTAEALQICKASFQRSTGVEMDAETQAEYLRTLEAFADEAWKKPMDAGVQFHYADTCHAFGVLEQRIVPALDGNTVRGSHIYFRTTQP